MLKNVAKIVSLKIIFSLLIYSNVVIISSRDAMIEKKSIGWYNKNVKFYRDHCKKTQL